MMGRGFEMTLTELAKELAELHLELTIKPVDLGIKLDITTP